VQHIKLPLKAKERIISPLHAATFPASGPTINPIRAHSAPHGSKTQSWSDITEAVRLNGSVLNTLWPSEDKGFNQLLSLRCKNRSETNPHFSLFLLFSRLIKY